jgi:heat shock protein HslJ
MRRETMAAIAAVLVLAACDWLPGGTVDLDGAWVLTDGTHDGVALPMIEDASVTMTVDGDEIGGTAACNQYGGSIERSGSSITIGALSMTEMACAEPIMALESAYLAALAAVDRAERSGDVLTFSGPDTELAFVTLPPVPDAAMVGTVWLLDSIITGNAVSSVMGEPATLELAESGTISGSTGCRSFSGTYSIDEGRVTVTELATDMRACPPDLAPQDDHVLAVVGNSFTASIDGNRLTLMDGADGLGYGASE